MTMKQNMLDLMGKLSQLQNADKKSLTESKAEVSTTHKGGTKSSTAGVTSHQGRYGNEYQGDSDDEARDAVTGKKKKAPKVQAHDGEKRGRGRPAGSTAAGEGDGKKYGNAAALQSYIVGNKPSKAVEKLAKTKSNKTLKDWIESYEPALNEDISGGDVNEFGEDVYMDLIQDLIDNNRRYMSLSRKPRVIAAVKKYVESNGGVFDPVLFEEMYNQIISFSRDMNEEASMPSGLTATPMSGATAIKNAQGQVVATAATPQAAAMMTKGDVTLNPTEKLGEDAGGKTARIFFDRDMGEYTVKFYQNGKHIADADYFTDDKEDARGTAKAGCEECQDDEDVVEANMYEGKKAKPDFLDVDKDTDKKESFKKALKDKEAGKIGSKKVSESETVKTSTGRIHKGNYGNQFDVKADRLKAEPKKPSSGVRGRPAKDTGPVTSKSNDPFGRSPSTAPKGVKGTVYKGKANQGKDTDLDEAFAKKAPTIAQAKAAFGAANKRSDGKFDPLKHVKNPTAGEKTAAKDVKRGSYADRAAMLKSAEADDRLKEGKPSAGMTAKQKSAVATKASAGKDIGKAGKGFEKVAAKATKEYGSKEKGQKVAAAAMWKGQAKKVAESKMSELDADLKDPKVTDAEFKKIYGKTKSEMRISMKKKVSESVLNDSTGATLDHICKTFSREVADFKQTGNMDEDLYAALYDYYFDDMPYGVKKARTGDPYEWVSDRFQEDLPLDEGSREDFTTHGMNSTPAKSVAIPAKPAQTAWGRDPIAALTDRIHDKFASKPTPQFESWSSQLDSLLNEGISISSTTGQKGSTDSVTVTASDADAQALLAAIRGAGLGMFGGDDAKGAVRPGPSGSGNNSGAGEVGSGLAVYEIPSEEDDTAPPVDVVTDSGPEVDVEVEDGYSGMLDLIRKMTGQLSNKESAPVCTTCGSSACQCEDTPEIEESNFDGDYSDEALGINSDEEDDDYTDQSMRKGESGTKSDSEEEEEEEEDEEDEEEDEEESDDNEEEESDDNEEEELDESFANGADDTFQTDIDFMTNVISGGLNRKKRTQSVGNPVTIASTPMKESASLLSDLRKLSGL